MRLCTNCKSSKDVRLSKKANELLCRRHRAQIYRFGEIRKRTLADKNDFIKFNNHYGEMICYTRNGKEKGRTRIDVEDIERIKNAGSWCIDSNGYVMNGREGALHRFLLGKKNGLEIDHINRNKLDNTKANLRFVLHRVNTINRNSINAYQLPSGNWCAYIGWENKQHPLGTYETLEQARMVAEKVKKALCDGKDLEESLNEATV